MSKAAAPSKVPAGREKPLVRQKPTLRIRAVVPTLKAACSGCSRVAAIYSEDDRCYRFCRECTIAGYRASPCLESAPRFDELLVI